MSVGRITCPHLRAAALQGCLPVWSISHHRGYSSRESTAQSPQPCGSSCQAPLLHRRTPPGLCAGSLVTAWRRGSGLRIPWSPMQPDRDGPVALEYLLLLARWGGWVTPGGPTLGVLLVVPSPSAALGVYARARVLCGPFVMSPASCRLFTSECARDVGGFVGPPPSSFFCCFLLDAFFLLILLCF